MVSKEEVWRQMLTKLKGFADFLSENLDKDNLATDYLLSVQRTYEMSTENALKQTNRDVQTTSANIAGLSRFYGEFYWETSVDRIAQEYLNTLAELSVELLNAYGL